MSDFKAKMHQIRFPLGLCPRARWGAYSAPQNPLAVFKGPTFKERERKGEKRRRKGENKGKGKGREEEGREGKGPTRLISTAFADQISYP